MKLLVQAARHAPEVSRLLAPTGRLAVAGQMRFVSTANEGKTCPPGCDPETCDKVEEAMQSPFNCECPRLSKLVEGMRDSSLTTDKEVVRVLKKNPLIVPFLLENLPENKLEEAGERLSLQPFKILMDMVSREES